MVACAFDPVRRAAVGNPDLLRRLLRTGDDLLALAPTPSRRRLIGHHVRATLECAQRTIDAGAERERW